MVKDALEDLRPSQTPEFAECVARLLAVIASGERSAAAELVAESPGLVGATGPHPIWGGEPLPLQVAAELGRLAQIELLLDHGADPDAQSPGYGGGWTPLQLALNGEHHAAAELLVRRGAAVDLCSAAALGDSARVASLLERDPASISQRGPNGASALHLSTSVEMARMLVVAGADLHATDDNENTPERFAVWFPARRAVARFLLEASGRPADILFAAAAGELATVRELVGADRTALDAKSRPYDGPTRLSKGGDTPLHVAALHAHPEIVRLLLELGADPDARNADGQTALHLAAGGRGLSAPSSATQIQVAEILLDGGADIDAVEPQHGGRPLGWARFHGRDELAKFLADRGAKAG